MNISKSDALKIISSVINKDISCINPSMNFSEIGVNSIKFIEIVLKIEALTNQDFDEDRLSPIFFNSINDFTLALADM